MFWLVWDALTDHDTVLNKLHFLCSLSNVFFKSINYSEKLKEQKIIWYTIIFLLQLNAKILIMNNVLNHKKQT